MRHHRRRDPEIPQADLPPGRRQRVQPPGPGAQEAAAAGGKEGDEDWPHVQGRHVSGVWQCLEWRLQYSEKVLIFTFSTESLNKFFARMQGCFSVCGTWYYPFGTLWNIVYMSDWRDILTRWRSWWITRMAARSTPTWTWTSIVSVAQ